MEPSFTRFSTTLSVTNLDGTGYGTFKDINDIRAQLCAWCIKFRHF
jgi:hypothetical protein